jgi:hypothetical protein
MRREAALMGAGRSGAPIGSRECLRDPVEDEPRLLSGRADRLGRRGLEEVEAGLVVWDVDGAPVFDGVPLCETISAARRRRCSNELSSSRLNRGRYASTM